MVNRPQRKEDKVSQSAKERGKKEKRQEEGGNKCVTNAEDEDIAEVSDKSVVDAQPKYNRCDKGFSSEEKIESSH